MEEGMLTFGTHWHIPFEMSILGRHGVEGRETRKITFSTHTGTQVDAPLHFIENGISIEKIPLETLVGKVQILDFGHKGPGSSISKNDLKEIVLQERIIFKFGWEKNWPRKSYYKDYPYFTKDAALHLVENKVKLIGFDTPSPDDPSYPLSGNNLGTEADSPIHKILLGNNIILLEYLCNLSTLDDLDGWSIAALPLKIKGADGSPARICIFK